MTLVIQKKCFCGEILSAKRYTFCSKHRATNSKNKGTKGRLLFKDRLPHCKVCEKKLSCMSAVFCKNHVPMSEATKQKIRIASLKNGNKPPVMYGADNPLYGKGRKGILNPRWIADRSKLKRYNDESKDRRSSAYNSWRKQVWIRDSYKCKIADKYCSGRIEVHHILNWKDYPELRYEINNGITLCHSHHPRGREKENLLIPTFLEILSVNKQLL